MRFCNKDSFLYYYYHHHYYYYYFKNSSFQTCLPQLMLGSRLHLPVAQQIQDIERYSSYCVVIRNLVLIASRLSSPFCGNSLYYWRHFIGDHKRLPYLVNASWLRQSCIPIQAHLYLLCQLACVRYLCTAQILKVVGKSGKLINNLIIIKLLTSSMVTGLVSK